LTIYRRRGGGDDERDETELRTDHGYLRSVAPGLQTGRQWLV
jgi:hypothetical protein